MNLKELRVKGGFVSAAPVKRSVTWEHLSEDGEVLRDTFDVWVLKLSFGMIDSMAAPDEERARNAQLIAAAVRLGDHAKEQMTYEEAYQLQPALARILVIEVAEVNRLPKPKTTLEEADAPKDLAPSMSSGMSLCSTASAGAR